ncbi:MAG: isoprenylcysteine carboxylmethyltransferase family protein [Bacteroides sp.]|nr:isoprenylcysteine carboxylmethyltransferase family protein [Bacteroides sp.]
MDLSFYTTLQAGWLNAWIPSFGMIIIQFMYMLFFIEGGKRAVDTSWYTTKDKINSYGSSAMQILVLIVSIFIPLKIGTVWFIIGSIIFIPSLICFVYAFHCYANTPSDKTVVRGIYRYSRNPMYSFFFAGMFGVCIATASLWLTLIMIPFIILTHLIILGEERYCEQTYGEEYLKYKAETPRYLLIK